MGERRFMMATKAVHQLGDISSDVPDLMEVDEETESEYIGRWVTGFGFSGVHFPKETTRKLTDEEQAKYQRIHIGMSGMDIGPAIPAVEHKSKEQP